MRRENRDVPLASLLLVLSTASIGWAQEEPSPPPETTPIEEPASDEEGEVVDLDAIDDEMEGRGVLDRLGPVAAPLHLFGYGEIHFNDPKTGTMRDGDDALAEVHRFVIGAGYDFSEDAHFEVEVDFEHSFEEPEIEFAHLTIDLSDHLRLRGGSVLVPVGFMNETHEPPTFYSVERPQVETLLIPTSWTEIGVGALGSIGSTLDYRAYLLTGLDALDESATPPESNFSPLEGVRGGRTKTMRGPANDLAVAARLEAAPLLGARVGLSGYLGGADQDARGIGRVGVGIAEADLRLDLNPVEIRGVGAVASIWGADDLGDPAAGSAPGSLLWGAYGEIAYHFAPILPERYGHDIVPFVRYEVIDTQARVPGGFDRDPAGHRNVLSGGIAYFPHPDVAIKADIEEWRDGDDDRVTRLDFGIGWRY